MPYLGRHRGPLHPPPSISLIWQLLRKKADINEKRAADGRTALMLAVIKGEEAVVRVLLEEPKIELFSKDAHGRRAMTMQSDDHAQSKAIKKMLDVS